MQSKRGKKIRHDISLFSMSLMIQLLLPGIGPGPSSSAELQTGSESITARESLGQRHQVVDESARRVRSEVHLGIGATSVDVEAWNPSAYDWGRLGGEAYAQAFFMKRGPFEGGVELGYQRLFWYERESCYLCSSPTLIHQGVGAWRVLGVARRSFGSFFTEFGGGLWKFASSTDVGLAAGIGTALELAPRVSIPIKARAGLIFNSPVVPFTVSAGLSIQFPSSSRASGAMRTSGWTQSPDVAVSAEQEPRPACDVRLLLKPFPPVEAQSVEVVFCQRPGIGEWFASVDEFEWLLAIEDSRRALPADYALSTVITFERWRFSSVERFLREMGAELGAHVVLVGAKSGSYPESMGEGAYAPGSSAALLRCLATINPNETCTHSVNHLAARQGRAGTSAVSGVSEGRSRAMPSTHKQTPPYRRGQILVGPMLGFSLPFGQLDNSNRRAARKGFVLGLQGEYRLGGRLAARAELVRDSFGSGSLNVGGDVESQTITRLLGSLRIYAFRSGPTNVYMGGGLGIYREAVSVRGGDRGSFFDPIPSFADSRTAPGFELSTGLLISVKTMKVAIRGTYHGMFGDMIVYPWVENAPESIRYAGVDVSVLYPFGSTK